MSKMFLFTVCRNRFTVNATTEKEAIDILVNTLSKTQEELDSYSANEDKLFKKFKCFGTTLYQRDERYFMPNEKNIGLSDRIDLMLSPEFLNEKRLRFLLEKKIIRIREVKENITFGKVSDDWNDSDDDEKYSTY